MDKRGYGYFGLNFSTLTVLKPGASLRPPGAPQSAVSSSPSPWAAPSRFHARAVSYNTLRDVPVMSARPGARLLFRGSSCQQQAQHPQALAVVGFHGHGVEQHHKLSARPLGRSVQPGGQGLGGLGGDFFKLLGQLAGQASPGRVAQHGQGLGQFANAVGGLQQHYAAGLGGQFLLRNHAGAFCILHGQENRQTQNRHVRRCGPRHRPH